MAVWLVQNHKECFDLLLAIYSRDMIICSSHDKSILVSKELCSMLIRGVWIVNKVVGVGWCEAPQCKVAPAVYGWGTYLSTLKYYASLSKAAIKKVY